ncbi:MAG TPA: hypothetical protein VHO95_04450, partial [Candidatus Dormibacteraeota bacterium]|nr:hypothetical protein [Candidatus Dormibacteraeota bacterium]
MLLRYRRLVLSVSAIAAMVAAFSATPASADTGSILPIDDSQLQALTTTVGGTGGAESLATA